MSTKLCQSCEGTGVLPLMNGVIIQEFISGTQSEVIKYTCPYCGKIQTQVNTHGMVVSQAEMDSMMAM